MRDLSLFRRYELVFVLSTATIYVVRRLVEEVNRIDGLIGLSASGNGIAAGTFWRDITDYNHTLNNNIPLIAGVCLFLGAWYVFHNLAYPALDDRTSNQQFYFYCALTVVLLLLSAFVYHYGKLYVRYRHDQAGQIIGLKVYSLYSKRIVLADAIGLGIFLMAYQLLFEFFNYLHQSLAAEMPKRHWRISFLLFLVIIATVLSLIFVGHLPQMLWQGPTRHILLVIGIAVQILFLQRYVYTNVLPFIKWSSSIDELLFRENVLFLLAGLVGAIVVWGPYSGFYYHSYDPILPFAAIIWLGAIGIAYVRRVFAKEKAVLQTQVSAKSAELASLQAQINPHFLFNALNSLYATALKENSEKTADGIQKLGDMMRFMLQENNRDRIPLDKEVEYLRNYIEIQRMRIDETHNIEIRVTIQEPNRPIYIAPMMLTPFVENAFKHGISFRHPSWIYITLTLDDTRLYFKVHNTRHPKPADSSDHQDPEKDHSGVGLDNVRKRLDLIYPGRHQLDIQQSEQDYFVSLTLVYW